MNDIAWFLHRIPETVDTGALITHIIHFQRIVCTVGTDSVIGSDAAEDISYISSHGIHFLPFPGSHTAAFQKDRRNMEGTCRIIVGAACAHI